MSDQEPEGKPKADSRSFYMRFNPMSYPASVRGRVEIDYASKLSHAEKKWLAAFNEAEYGHNPGCLEYITQIPVSQHERRRMYRELKRYERDTLSAGGPIDAEIYYAWVDSIASGQEDLYVEMIDKHAKIQKCVIDTLKVLIRLKYRYLDQKPHSQEESHEKKRATEAARDQSHPPV